MTLLPRAEYVRFVTRDRDSRSHQLKGIFTSIYALERAGELLPHEVTWFAEVEKWFNANLPEPKRLGPSARSPSKAHAITWLKMTATDHLAKLRELAELLRCKDIQVEELRTTKPGYIVYEDDHQVAAIPFSSETFNAP